MNICYHYYTIKTLAVKAGFTENEAQQIAYYSQMVDDFHLSNPVILKEQPPDFFLENNLAWQINDDEWGMLPCGTGIDVLKSLSVHYQEHTLAPFHFIPPKDFVTLKNAENPERTDYRCICAGEREDLLIHEIVNEATKAVKAQRSLKNLMALGMALHTYADTYAHCNYSGLHGYENEAVLKKAYNRMEKAKEIPIVESNLLRDLPPIGHAQVETAPDICSKHIQYQMKTTKTGGFDLNVERDNAIYFSACSREILNLLCQITGSPIWSDEEWIPLQEALIRAQAVKMDQEKYLDKSFGEEFPEIIYSYHKNSKLGLSLNVNYEEINDYQHVSDYETVESELELRKGDVSREELIDAFSPKGNFVRNSYKVQLESADQQFFDYSELAYRRVMKVTGEHMSQERVIAMQAACTGTEK